jgi:hypothetical protein
LLGRISNVSMSRYLEREFLGRIDVSWVGKTFLVLM